MKTVILAGMDNLVFSAADLLNPMELKLIGFATTIEQAWNIYDENGQVIEQVEEMPVMPVDAAISMEPDCVILTSGTPEDEETLKYMLYRGNYRGEVFSLFEFFQQFSFKTAAIRKMVWRLRQLGVEGAAADLGAYRGDLSWQLNALMPERKLYLFDTFTGYDEGDIEKRILSRMPYREQVEIRAGSFPETAYELEEESYALVHIDTDFYQTAYTGIQYFFSRLNRGGVIFVTGYESGRHVDVRQAIHDLEQRYGAFVLTPVNDSEGTVMILRP